MIKNGILALACTLVFTAAQAQKVVNVTGGNKKTYYLDANASVDCHMPFTQVTGKATVLAYSMVSSDFPMNWLVSFCDNRSCFATLVQEDSFAVIPKDGQSEFKITVDPQGKADTSTVIYTVYDRANPSKKDTVEFHFVLQWGAGLMESATLSHAIYPNPTADQLNFINLSNDINVRVYGTNNKLVKSEIICASKPEMDVRNLPGGFYFISYNNGKELVRSSFVKQ